MERRISGNGDLSKGAPTSIQPAREKAPGIQPMATHKLGRPAKFDRGNAFFRGDEPAGKSSMTANRPSVGDDCSMRRFRGGSYVFVTEVARG